MSNWEKGGEKKDQGSKKERKRECSVSPVLAEGDTAEEYKKREADLLRAQEIRTRLSSKEKKSVGIEELGKKYGHQKSDLDFSEASQDPRPVRVMPDWETEKKNNKEYSSSDSTSKKKGFLRKIFGFSRKK